MKEEIKQQVIADWGSQKIINHHHRHINNRKKKYLIK
jgi:hypothetical protein